MGELAALATSVLWSFTSIQFTMAGRRVGSSVVNRVRLVLALLYLSVAHLLLTGQVWPVGAEPYRWLWLSLSGIVGLVLGDASLFQAYVVIGPRRSQLVMTSAPLITTAVAWLWFGETLQPAQLGAMAITIGGIVWVVSERRPTGRRASFPGDANHRAYLTGLLLAFGGALGQAFGLLLARRGLEGDFSPLSATLIRMLVGMVVMWSAALIGGRVNTTLAALRDRRAFGLIASAAFTGPFLGVWLSMIAVQNAPMGIASTLLALPPILLIPLSAWIFGERITLRAVAGTAVALAGAALIVLM
jgi:drug/metabolite transporter (DMT)-like permease